MFCPRCGAKITEEMKFCANCGCKITDDMKNEKSRISASNNNTQIEKVIKKNKSEKKSIKNKDVLKKSSITNNEKKKNIWSNFSVIDIIIMISIVFSFLLFVAAFTLGRTFSVIFSVLQITLLVVSYLIKKDVIKIFSKKLYIILMTIAFVIVIPYVLLFSFKHEDKNVERINWSELNMGEVIPEPDLKLGNINSNSDDYLVVEIDNMSLEQYKDYVKACKEKGFTVDSEQTSSSYDTYNKEGYKLSLDYRDSIDQLRISLDAPIEMSQFDWPTSEYGKILPTPKSTYGKIEIEDKRGFEIYIGKITLDDYNAYVRACSKKGFVVDSKKTQKSYTAKNADSYKLTVEYKGNNTMYISVKEPEFDIEIKVRCRKNLFFSMYDVNFYIDDRFIGTIKHGATEIYDEVLKKGTHILKFVNVDDDTVTGKVKIDMTKAEKLEYELWCRSSNVDVDNALSSDNDKTTDKDTTEKDEENTSTINKTESESEKVEFEETESEEIITIDNCPELAEMLSIKAEIDDSYSDFATNYKGRIIEFDGRIDGCLPHKNYKTRFDYLVSAGDYDPDHQRGPTFKFKNVNYYDLNTDLETVSIGLNVHIVAEVVSFDSDHGLFYLDPVSVTSR